MRIAVVCSDLGVRVPGSKGASLHLAAITRAFAGLGHEVLLVGVRGHAPTDGIRTLLLEHPGRAQGLHRELRKLRFTRHLARDADGPVTDFAPDLLYERLALFGTAGSRLADRAGAVHVVEVNALLAQEEARWRGLRLARTAQRMERAVLSHADLRVAVSAELASTWVGRSGLNRSTSPASSALTASRRSACDRTARSSRWAVRASRRPRHRASSWASSALTSTMCIAPVRSANRAPAVPNRASRS